MNIRECNFPHLVDIFMKMYLFYGLKDDKNLKVKLNKLEDRMSGATETFATPTTKVNNLFGVPSTPTLPTTTVGFGTSAAPLVTPTSYASVTKVNQLNNRLGADASSSFSTSSVFSPTLSISNKSTPSTTTSTPAYSGYGVYAAAVTPSSNRKALGRNDEMIDIYEVPSKEFPGLLQFFFRFIVHVDSSRFNSCLADCISAEIMSLIQPEDSINSSTTISINHSGKLRSKLSSLDSESFAELVCKLRLLGKMLGLLHFYSKWDGIDSKLLRQQSIDLVAKQQQMSLSLPFVTLIEEAYSSCCLCLHVSWMSSYYKMSKWDQSILHVATHLETLNYLHSIQHRSSFRFVGMKPTVGNEDEDSSNNQAVDNLSCNRLYVLMEIQSLMEDLQPDLTLSATVKRYYSDSNATLNVGRTNIDDNNQAFTLLFLHHVYPDLEAVREALKSQNYTNESLKSKHSVTRTAPMLVTVNQMTTKKKKIKTSLETVEENSVPVLTSVPKSTTPTQQVLTSPTNINPDKKKKNNTNSDLNSVHSSTDSIQSLNYNQFQPLTTPSKGLIPRPPGLTINRNGSTPTTLTTPTKGRSSSALSAIARGSPSPVKMRSVSLAESLYDAGDNTIGNIQLSNIKDR